MRWLLLLFIVFPFVELYLLLAVGHQIGFWPTLGLIILSGVVGSIIARREGTRVLREWQKSVHELRPPEQGVLEGVLVIAGSVLLIVPGLLSDVFGLVLLIPFTRRLLVGPIRRAVQAYIARGQLRVMHIGSPGASGGMPWGAPSDLSGHDGSSRGPFGGGPFGSGPFGHGSFGSGGPFGAHDGPFGRSASQRGGAHGGVVDTTGETVSEPPRQLSRGERR